MASRKGHRRGPGSFALTAKRVEYFRLMKQGLSSSEACRHVGVNRKTGQRWRLGRTFTSPTGKQYEYPPADTVETQTSGRYLSLDERHEIADGLRSRQTLTVIASTIGRSVSTVSREVKRNSDPETGEYRPYRADKTAAQRRARPKQRKLAWNNELCGYVQDGLSQKWSPEQVSARLVVDFPERKDMRISPESVYQGLYHPGETGLQRDLVRKLRTGRTQRRRHRQAAQRRKRGFIDPSMMIDQRPKEIEEREEVGHWEGDLIVGTLNQSAIGTLVERVTRTTLLVHVNGKGSADDLAASLTETYDQLPEWLRKSLTWDQGVEMAGHESLTEANGIKVYFCEARSPWQRGSNENTNGLLRQYFPKSTDLSVYTPDDLKAAQDQLNNRPRKILDWQTPNEALDTIIKTHRIATTT